jgi:hypothetical protein
MKLLFENWRKILNEISFEDAKKRLEKKALTSWIKGMAFDEETKTMTLNPEQVEKAKNALAEVVLQFVPEDLTDGKPDANGNPTKPQKGLTLEWIISVGINDPTMKPRFYNEAISTVAPGNHSIRSALLDANIKRGDFERYWHTHDYSDQKDIFSIDTWGKLAVVAEKAKKKYDDAMQDKEFEDPEKGTEVFDHPDKNKWFIAALHTKAAACHYGKRTDWCTATDTDMFDQYYESDDPLFYFEDRQVFDRASLSKRAPEKDDWANPNVPTPLGRRRQDGRFQFHFGSEQFMDNNDAQVDEETRDYFVDLLSKTSAVEKYPAVQYWVTKNEVAQRIYDENTTSEDLFAIAKEYSGQGEREIIEMIIDSDMATGEILQYLILSGDEAGEEAIGNPMITDEWINSLASSEDGHLRYIAAVAVDYHNRGNVLTPETADKLSEDPLVHIRKKIAGHPSASPETLAKMANRLMKGGEDEEHSGSVRTFLSNLLRNNNLPTNLFVPLIEWSKTRTSDAVREPQKRHRGSGSDTVREEPGIYGTIAPLAMESAARNKNAPPEVLVDIYNTFDNTAESGYRFGSIVALAQNEKTPEDILLKISKNKNSTIKYEAQKTLEKLADKTGMDSLRENFKRFLK